MQESDLTVYNFRPVWIFSVQHHTEDKYMFRSWESLCLGPASTVQKEVKGIYRQGGELLQKGLGKQLLFQLSVLLHWDLTCQCELVSPAS